MTFMGRLRRGMTLIELMIVVAIIVVVMAVAIPAVRPALKSRKVREASRMVSAYFARAKSIAVKQGRPAGVWIERLEYHKQGPPVPTATTRHLQSLQFYIAETPPPYQGDLTTARAGVYWNAMALPAPRWEVIFSDSPTLDRLVQPGVAVDQPGETFSIKLDYKGHQFHCIRFGTLNPPFAAYQIDVSPTFNLPPPGAMAKGADGAWGQVGVDDDMNGTIDDRGEYLWLGSDDQGLPFTVTLSPRRSTETPLQMPRGVCIDLSVSGITADGVEFNPFLRPRPGLTPAQAASATTLELSAPVIIMFNPTGDIEQVYIGWLPQPTLGSVHLLVGRTEQVSPPDVFLDGGVNDFKANLVDLQNLWTSIGHRTGTVNTSPLALSNPADPANIRILNIREFARTAIDKGSR